MLKLYRGIRKFKDVSDIEICIAESKKDACELLEWEIDDPTVSIHEQLITRGYVSFSTVSNEVLEENARLVKKADLAITDLHRGLLNPSQLKKFKEALDKEEGVLEDEE